MKLLASRKCGFSSPPPALATLLFAVSLIPSDIELPNESDLLDELKSKSAKNGVGLINDVLAKCLAGLPEEFQKYVWGELTDNYDVDHSLENAFKRYSNTRQFIEALPTLIKVSGLHPVDRTIHFWIYPLTTQVNIEIEDDNRLYVELPSWVKLLVGQDISRLRQCPVCNRYFWAGRKTQKACTPRCAHNLRNRNYRERYPQKYKWQRYEAEEKRAGKQQKGAKTSKKARRI